MFNFKNVYDKRTEFENACKDAGACKTEYKKLVSAQTKEEFMKVIYNNYYWINRTIDDFEPKYLCVSHFSNGIVRIWLSEGKQIFMNTDGDLITENQFEDAWDFQDEFATVKFNGLWGCIRTDGSWLVEPKFQDMSLVRKTLIYRNDKEMGWIDTNEPKMKNVYSTHCTNDDVTDNFNLIMRSIDYPNVPDYKIQYSRYMI